MFSGSEWGGEEAFADVGVLVGPKDWDVLESKNDGWKLEEIDGVAMGGFGRRGSLLVDVEAG